MAYIPTRNDPLRLGIPLGGWAGTGANQPPLPPLPPGADMGIDPRVDQSGSVVRYPLLQGMAASPDPRLMLFVPPLMQVVPPPPNGEDLREAYLDAFEDEYRRDPRLVREAEKLDLAPDEFWEHVCIRRAYETMQGHPRTRWDSLIDRIWAIAEGRDGEGEGEGEGEGGGGNGGEGHGTDRWQEAVEADPNAAVYRLGDRHGDGLVGPAQALWVACMGAAVTETIDDAE
ncbi:MAG: hypothetical protein Q9208_001853 [Pyrenodesmia sp. 3 TL-2023]